MKIAVVCDWLVTYAGAEKVLEQILNIYPEADLFALVDFLDEDKRGFIKHKKDRKSTRLNSSHSRASRMPSSA